MAFKPIAIFSCEDFSSLVLMKITKVGVKIMFLIFFIRNYNYGCIKIFIYISWVCPLQSWCYFSTNYPPLSTHFSTFVWDAPCQSYKHLLLKHWSSSRALCFSLSSSKKWHPWNASTQGPKRWTLDHAKSTLLPTMSGASKLPDLLVLRTVALGSEHYICGFLSCSILVFENMSLFCCNFTCVLFPS